MNDNIFTKCDNSSDSVYNVHNIQNVRNINNLRSSSIKQIPQYKTKESKTTSAYMTRQTVSEKKKDNMVHSNKNIMVKDGNSNRYNTSSCHKTLQEKLEAINKNYPLEENLDTEKKCQMLLNNIQDAYTDKDSLQDMLDETLVLLKEQENENDKLKIRCREYLKIIEKQYNKIKQLEQLLEEYDDEVFKKNFIKKYI